MLRLKRRQDCGCPASLAFKVLTVADVWKSEMFNVNKRHFHAAIWAGGAMNGGTFGLGTISARIGGHGLCSLCLAGGSATEPSVTDARGRATVGDILNIG